MLPSIPIPLLWHLRPVSPALACFPRGAKVAATAQSSHSVATTFCHKQKRLNFSVFLILKVSKLSRVLQQDYGQNFVTCSLVRFIVRGMGLHVWLGQLGFSLELRIGLPCLRGGI